MASRTERYYRFVVADLTSGELFLAGFVVFLVVTARYWPALGARIANALAGSRSDERPGGGDADDNQPQKEP